ncbi:hypothetical protein CTAYLR_006860 [Chrysophaeum taylorii]|uniref:PDZ domain-containing protein n=1 Tax=Chrysophaeum taylorii TaxID=2483200 RepID=A0AAD7XHE1_9STRA|nr:hypothetical protein CTAYLR_006860 [Chrysophaeum taylorii]
MVAATTRLIIAMMWWWPTYAAALQLSSHERLRVRCRMGRWDPPPTGGRSAAEDLSREAIAAASGAFVADARATVVELPRGATGIEWGTDLSFVGVYVRALEPGGAAELSGLARPGAQLVAINGTQVFNARFDEVMSLLGREAPVVNLEFFDGTRDDLFAATGISTNDVGDDLTITVKDGDRVVAEIPARKGVNLRDALVGYGLDVYRGTTRWTNCSGKQMCGTCIVDFEKGAEVTNRKSNDEDGTLNLQKCAPSTRLSCVTFAYGDVTVSLQPERSGFFGSATSGSAW